MKSDIFTELLFFPPSSIVHLSHVSFATSHDYLSIVLLFICWSLFAISPKKSTWNMRLPGSEFFPSNLSITVNKRVIQGQAYYNPFFLKIRTISVTFLPSQSSYGTSIIPEILPQWITVLRYRCIYFPRLHWAVTKCILYLRGRQIYMMSEDQSCSFVDFI